MKNGVQLNKIVVDVNNKGDLSNIVNNEKKVLEEITKIDESSYVDIRFILFMAIV